MVTHLLIARLPCGCVIDSAEEYGDMSDALFRYYCM